MRASKAIQAFLEPGEQVLGSCAATGSVDIAVDLPPNGRMLQAYLSSQRLLFVDHAARQPRLVWWTWLDEVRRVDIEVRWQNRVVNRGRETIVSLHMHDGRTITHGHIHHIDGLRKTKRFTEAVAQAVNRSGNRPGMR